MDAAAVPRFYTDFLEQSRALLERGRTATADDIDTDGVHLGWLLERGRGGECCGGCNSIMWMTGCFLKHRIFQFIWGVEACKFWGAPSPRPVF